MSSNDGLTAPGSSTYASDTLHVGDGTWDSSRDTFLLPNLMGLNFDTMRYNGMGNRFRDMPGYHSIILAHGVIGTIVFLGLVPVSVLIIRYYSTHNSYWAFRLHVWAQVLTLLLSTVVFVLGWFAVGPKRSLTNPHHGIGLAIYVMVIAQVLWGWFVHRVERRKKRRYVPLKLVFHRWLGRALAILGIVQIPLGLTLYGSPKSLFILFALAAFALLVAWFVLSYFYDTQGYYIESDYDGRRSYISGPSVVSDRHSAAGAAPGAGVAEAFRRRPRSRNASQSYDDSHISDADEKFSDEAPRRHGGLGKRVMEIGALAGAAALAKRFFDRRRNRENDSESGRYRPASSRSVSITEESLSRIEDGRPERSRPAAHSRPPSGPPSRQPSRSPRRSQSRLRSRSRSRSQSPYSTYYSGSGYNRDNAGPSNPIRNAFAGAGIFGAVRNLFGGRKQKEEERRVDDILRLDAEEERIARVNSRRYTGDGTLPRRNRRISSYTATDMSSTDMSHSTQHGERPMASGAVNPSIPPLPPAHRSALTADDPHQGPSNPTAELPGMVAGGAAMASPSSPHHHGNENADSPPVSVKVRMHNDGRHVTLRRLTEQEAAASREARRERRNSRRRHGSVSSLSGNEGGYDRWRRVEELERQQAERIRREQQAAAAAGGTAPPPPIIPPAGTMPANFRPPSSHPYNAPPPVSAPPPPPPMPAPSSLPYGPGSFTSPTYTGTEASGDYASNRRRRRAERARARHERQQNSAEFT